VPVTSGGVVAQVWRGGCAHQAQLARIVEAIGVNGSSQLTKLQPGRTAQDPCSRSAVRTCQSARRASSSRRQARFRRLSGTRCDGRPDYPHISCANEFWEPSGEPTCSDTRRRQATSSHGSRR
jgi:hypothetical protein